MQYRYLLIKTIPHTHSLRKVGMIKHEPQYQKGLVIKDELRGFNKFLSASETIFDIIDMHAIIHSLDTLRILDTHLEKYAYAYEISTQKIGLPEKAQWFEVWKPCEAPKRWEYMVGREEGYMTESKRNKQETDNDDEDWE